MTPLKAYVLGVLTTPLAAGLVYTVRALTTPTSTVSYECGARDFKVYPYKHEPEWVFAFRSRWKMGDHIRNSPRCAEKINRALAQRGASGRWVDGRFKKNAGLRKAGEVK